MNKNNIWITQELHKNTQWNRTSLHLRRYLPKRLHIFSTKFVLNIENSMYTMSNSMHSRHCYLFVLNRNVWQRFQYVILVFPHSSIDIIKYINILKCLIAASDSQFVFVYCYCDLSYMMYNYKVHRGCFL